jgi:hypothetical protein
MIGHDPRTVTEKALQGAIYDCARRLGYMAYHVWDSRKSTPGFPDLILLRTEPAPPRLIVAELKTERGRLSAHQEVWLHRFLQIDGVEVYLWKPSQWLSGEVEAILRGEQTA